MKGSEDMTFLAAAAAALRQTGRPMRPEEMVSLALKEGWLGQVGKTPSATMRAQLGLQVKKPNSAFCRVAPGLFGFKSADKVVQMELLEQTGKTAKPAHAPQDKRGRNSQSVGCVYILSNPSFKNDWLKIGQTSDSEPWARMKELYSTPVPLPFSCVAYMQTRRSEQAEKLIHSIIDRFTHKRINAKREFFRMGRRQAIATLRDVAETVHGVVHEGPFEVDDDRGAVTGPAIAERADEWRVFRNGIRARGRYSDGRLEVLAGSQVSMTKPIGRPSLDRLREKLKTEGVLVEKKHGVFVLKRKQVFTSPSAASCFVIGSASNGWREWKNANGERLEVMRKGHERI